MRALALFLLAACSGGKSTTPVGAPVAPADAAKPPSGPEQLCLAGDCADGKGILTIGRGADRAIVDGAYKAGARTGDAVVWRVAGSTFEKLEIDAASGTGTLRHPDFDVVGQITADPAPQLSDATAAVMLPTGEWFFAEWSPTAVAAKDSNLTGARRVPKLPDDYSDLLAGVSILEEARHAGRMLQLRPPGEDDTPFTTPITLAPTPLVAFVPATKEPIAYIVGVGVVDPDSPAIAMLRKGATPTGPITILRADGASSVLEIKDGAVARWPQWNTASGNWKMEVTSQLEVIEHERAASATALHAGDAATVVEHLQRVLGAVETAQGAMRGTEAERITKLAALRDEVARSLSRAQLAAKLAELAKLDAKAVLADALGQIALDFDVRGIAP